MRPLLAMQPNSPMPVPRDLSFGAPPELNTSATLAKLLSSQRPFVLRGRQPLFREGDDADSVYLLVSGCIRMFNFMANGRRLVARFAFSGDIVGLSFGTRYPSTAEAIKSAVICRISRAKLNSLCEHSTSLRNDIILMLKQELQTTETDMLPMMHQNAEQRIARLLMMLARRECRALKQGSEVHVSMTRTDIADFLGLTVETVCRGFTKLKEERMITACASDVIRVNDARGLLALAESEH